MSRDTDTALAIAYKQELIKKHISIDTCKECTSSYIRNNELVCLQEQPNTDNCNLLKIHYAR